jgi:hypothetical protein
MRLRTAFTFYCLERLLFAKKLTNSNSLRSFISLFKAQLVLGTALVCVNMHLCDEVKVIQYVIEAARLELGYEVKRAYNFGSFETMTNINNDDHRFLTFY